MNDYDLFEESEALDGWLTDTVSQVWDSGTDLVSNAWEGIKSTITGKVEQTKQDTQNQINDALDIDAQAKAAFDKKFNAELERASKNLQESLVSMFSAEEIQQKVADGTIVLNASGQAVRDPSTGKILSLAEYQKLQLANQKKLKNWLGAIGAILTSYRDNPSFRAQYDAKLQQQINTTTDPTKKAKLVKSYNDLKAWLVVNPSPNPLARTTEQLQRIDGFKQLITKVIINQLAKFKASPSLFQTWRDNQNAALQKAYASGDTVAVQQISKRIDDLTAAVQSPLSAEQYVTKAVAKAEQIATAGSNQSIAQTESGLLSGKSAGVGLLAIAAGAYYFMQHR